MVKSLLWYSILMMIASMLVMPPQTQSSLSKVFSLLWILICFNNSCTSTKVQRSSRTILVKVISHPKQLIITRRATEQAHAAKKINIQFDNVLGSWCPLSRIFPQLPSWIRREISLTQTGIFHSNFQLFVCCFIYLLFLQKSVVQLLYESFACKKGETGESIFVFWDKECLNYWQNWQEGFLLGLKNAIVIVLLISEHVSFYFLILLFCFNRK